MCGGGSSSGPSLLGSVRARRLFLHTPGPCQSLQRPPCSVGDFLSLLLLQPCRAPFLRLFSWSSSAEARSQVLSEWQRKGQVLCLTAVSSLTSATTGLAHVSLSVMSCSLQMLAGPIAWPWPLQTLCGGQGRERRGHTVSAPGLCCCCSAWAGRSCRASWLCASSSLGNRLLMQAVWAEGPCLCPPRPLPCAQVRGSPDSRPDVLGGPALEGHPPHGPS